MTSERPRFPVGLTLAAIVVIAICTALGVWQLQRAAWKTKQLARIAAVRNGPPLPIGQVLRRASLGEDMSQTRVSADCSAAAPAATKTTVRPDNGDWVERAQSLCRLTGAPYDGIWVDRGIVSGSRGTTEAKPVALPAPVHVTGILYAKIYDCLHPPPAKCAWEPGIQRLANYMLVAERETPAPPGVTPTPYPDAASNLEYVGTYAPTWFGLAVVAACFYAAMLWRRYHPKP